MASCTVTGTFTPRPTSFSGAAQRWAQALPPSKKAHTAKITGTAKLKVSDFHHRGDLSVSHLTQEEGGHC